MSSDTQLSLLDSFDFTVQRSRRKTLSIIVREGKVEVKAPLRAPDAWIESFIEEKTPWIQKQLHKQEQKISERLVIAHDQRFTLMDRELRFDIIRSGSNRAERHGDRLCLYCRDNNPKTLDSVFQRWLKAQACDYMIPKTEEYAQQLGLAPNLKRVNFRKTRSKWGHCDRDGVIQYNWLVMMAPQVVVDYLVAHETSHLKHMDHSTQFWHTVGSLCPDYLTLRHWLRDHGHRFWTADETAYPTHHAPGAGRDART